MATLNGVQLYPRDSIFNTDISGVGVHASSNTWITTMGSYGLQISLQLPLTLVPVGQQLVTIHLGTYASESDAGPSPVPPNAGVENNSDKHVLVLSANGYIYELYHGVLQGDNSWNADQQSIFWMGGYALRTNNWTSADAAGLPMLPLVLRYAEANSGTIDHAVRLVVNDIAAPNIHIWPGRHDNGFTSNNNPPFGARIRLKNSFNISGFSTINQTILQALKKYGAFISDQSGGSNGLTITADTDNNWDTGDLANLLSGVHVSNFEFVDESFLQLSANSHQIIPLQQQGGGGGFKYMASPSVIQNWTVASSSASPTSLNASGTATQAGTTMLLFVFVTGTGTSISTPANFSVIFNPAAQHNTSLAVFQRQNNPGGVTSVAITVGGSSGGAVAVMLEVANMPTGQSAFESMNNFSSAGTTSPGIAATKQPPVTDMLVLGVIGLPAASVTNLNGTTLDIANTVTTTLASTNGTPNAQFIVAWGLAMPGQIQQIAATLGSSVAAWSYILRMYGATTEAYTNTYHQGVAGSMLFQGA